MRAGSGRDIDIWNSPWLPNPITFKVGSPSKILPKNATVDQLINHLTATWDHNLIDNIFWEDEAAMIKAISLANCLDAENSWMWHYSRDESFTVRSAYHAILGSNLCKVNTIRRDSSGGGSNMLWNKIWSMDVLNKFKHHLWRLATNSLPTLDNLHRPQVRVDKMCPVCNGRNEDQIHLLFSCTVATSVWALCFLTRRIQSVVQVYMKSNSIRDFAWTKYFGHGRSRKVTSMVETDDIDNQLMVDDLSSLFLGPSFARGAHGELHRGTYKDDSVAVKISRILDDYHNNLDSADKIQKQFDREFTFLSRLHHPNVLKFVAAYKQPPTFMIITEYVSGGSLRSYLNKIERNRELLPLIKVIAMALDIARGMGYIHSQGIVHRDLKPDNILISNDFHLKVADFGLACEESQCRRLTDIAGTYRWMAPEMVKGKKSNNRKIDVYSFGLILWELVAGTVPFEDMTPEQVAFAVVNKNLRPHVPERCHPTMRALIEQCWCSKPEKRLEFWQIVETLEHLEA
ncbi:hypothetical protein ACH5RR_001594 [Cinchona calisaya]|uniref:Protein kinase domain-containing protein n=1 Tax=Cinchona calisaya TaxID=153742 RepID=A0ABD3B4H3_9GENT